MEQIVRLKRPRQTFSKRLLEAEPRQKDYAHLALYSSFRELLSRAHVNCTPPPKESVEICAGCPQLLQYEFIARSNLADYDLAQLSVGILNPHIGRRAFLLELLVLAEAYP
ncbi:hypothetical protein [Paraburkholderia azotifigens]|uniref:Uncharacterized protein n=1 Tax=Paraburkholderia azotifigens TaxID=2057004 RepID=A0A5C6V341_9BURK|nr:hypothetical protein [Paraburkholderia azotifigens]TXC79101.1 hypothetical protein FRZ40_32275 [Paraburkholderia azotifigens]